MIYKRIALHEMVWCRRKAMISTVQISDTHFETMVMYNDGTELESFHTGTLKEARRVHNEAVMRWNDKIYEGSTAKCLGIENLGQFVKTVVAC